MLADKWLTPTSRDARTRGAVWLAVLAGTTMAIGVIAIWFVINDRAREHIASATDYATRINQLLIRQDIDNRLSALDRLARRWTAAGGTPRPIWEADAARYVGDMTGFQAIEWADATLHIRWIVPLEGNEAAQDLDISQIEQARIAIAAARESGKATLTQPFELVQGGLGIAVYLPVTRDKQFDGVIVGVLRLESWLNAIIARVQSADYHARMFLQGYEVYRQYPGNVSIDESWTQRSEFEIHGLTWTTLITPTKEFVAATHAGLSTLILIVGLLFSTLVAIVVYLALVARYRSLQLHETASQLEMLFQNLPGMAYRCTGQANRPMEFVSEGCQKLSGYSGSDFVEQRVFWGDLIHPDDRDSVSQKMRQAIDNADAYEIEYRIVTRAKQERWMWERGRAVSLEGRNNDIRLEGFISDVTDRKRAVMALIDARAFSEAVVDTAAEAVITIGASGDIETFNRAAQQMFGYSVAEVQGKNVNVLMPEPHHAEHDKYIERYLETNEAHIIGSGREIIAQRKDGTDFPIHLAVSEVRNRRERKFVGLIRDISRQHAAENEARQHREQLAHVDRLYMLGEMATGIAHEINQPLTAISLFAEAGKRLFGAGNQDRLPEIFDKLSQHAQRAGAVIERMQTMARRQESAKEIADCNALVEEATELAEAEARIRDMTIEVVTENELPPVVVDTVQIQQVVLNLLRNGMEAMRSVDCRDGNSIRLQTQLCDDGDVEVAVIDKGCGVSEEVAKSLFTPFSTTKESGMGMGLSISRAIVIAHGGHLDFYNNDSGGATFFFTLPAAKQKD
ncbi:MAG: PAS domain S-box protein [Proteobacteria bacterium]|nr:PAS domain S-box protein [Pseudomonadota bacterium]